MSILLIRLRLVGDVVFTTPAVRALRRRFPSARIVYVVEAGAAPVVATNPHIDELIVLERARGWRRIADDWRTARRLRRARFDLVVDFHGGPRSSWLAWATRAPARVGYDVAGRAWLYTRTVPRSRRPLPRHAVENQWDLLAAVDAGLNAPPSPETDRVEMPVAAEAVASIARRLAAWGVPPDARLIAMHVSAGNPFRRWPESAFVELVSSLAGADPRRWVVLTGGPSDRDATRRVLEAARARLGADGARICDGDALSLAELRALMDRAAAYVGGDSGPLHVAATSDVPIVGMYGPTLPVRSAPWRPARLATASVEDVALGCRPCDQRVCAPGDFRCLTGIPAAAVREAVERVLEARA